MNILICPDKFKGSLTAAEVCEAIHRGILRADPGARVKSVPLADGGEGTCALLTEWNRGQKIFLEVTGPSFSPVKAQYGISKDGLSAFIEMAEASGLALVQDADRNPLYTTTLGTGEMIADALARGVKHIVLGIGGSATNDAGIGMATALGYVFCDVEGQVLAPTGENLIHIHRVKTDKVDERLKNLRVIALCDVTNPLHGPDGAAFIYGPQKGADKAAVALLDAGLRNFRRIVHKQLNTSVDFPGAGAAGGLGAGARVFLNASMQKGVSYIMQTTRLADEIRQADLVITGEGKIDHQTLSGKVISEVLRLAEAAHKPVVAVCGVCEISAATINRNVLKKIICLVDGQTSPESAIRNASSLVTEKVALEFDNSLRALN